VLPKAGFEIIEQMVQVLTRTLALCWSMGLPELPLLCDLGLII